MRFLSILMRQKWVAWSIFIWLNSLQTINTNPDVYKINEMYFFPGPLSRPLEHIWTLSRKLQTLQPMPEVGYVIYFFFYYFFNFMCFFKYLIFSYRLFSRYLHFFFFTQKYSFFFLYAKISVFYSSYYFFTVFNFFLLKNVITSK